MHFGEYELSPSLIGLSLLSVPHREIFHHFSVGPSMRFYPHFSLDTDRSLGFASTLHNYTPFKTRFRYGSTTGSLSLAVYGNS